MIEEHDCVVLTSDIPAQGLQAGDVGTVVHVVMLTEQPAPPLGKGEATELPSAVSLSYIQECLPSTE